MVTYRLITFIFAILLLASCSSLKPLYSEGNEINQIIANMKIFPIEGRYGVFLKNELTETFGTKVGSSEEDSYSLVSEITTSTGGVESFSSDGTASRSGASVSVSYSIVDERGCSIFGKTISTDSTYNTKSGGYDFGNIASQRSAIERNIEYNVKHAFPHIYSAIGNKPEPVPFIAPFISNANFRGC